MHKPQREPEGCCLIVPKQSKEGLNPSSTAGPRVIIRTRNRTRKPSGLGISAKRDYAMEACYSQSRNKEEQRALRTEDVRRRHSALLSRLMTVQQRGHMKTEVVPSVHNEQLILELWLRFKTNPSSDHSWSESHCDNNDPTCHQSWSLSHWTVSAVRFDRWCHQFQHILHFDETLLDRAAPETTGQKRPHLQSESEVWFQQQQ